MRHVSSGTCQSRLLRPMLYYPMCQHTRMTAGICCTNSAAPRVRCGLRHLYCFALQLTGGQLVAINAKLVKKQRFHFTTLQGLDVDIIAGLNGLIWVSPHVQRLEDGTPAHQQQQQQAGGGAEPVDSAAAVAAAAAAAQGPSREQREAVVRVAGAIRALAALMLQVYPGSIIEAYQVGWVFLTQELLPWSRPEVVGCLAQAQQQCSRRRGVWEGMYLAASWGRLARNRDVLIGLSVACLFACLSPKPVCLLACLSFMRRHHFRRELQ